MAASVAASAEAMRPMRWPAERLDTLGGYLTYHNVLLFNLLLAVYGAVVGAKVLRGAEERHAAEEVRAGGVSRRALLVGRTAGFVLVALMVSSGPAVGTALGMAGGGEPDLAGAVITCATTGLVMMVGFALGVLAGQVARDARTAAGLASLLLVVLYLSTTLDGAVAGAPALATASPFTYANRSRALIPGYGLDLGATLVLVLAATTLLTIAAVADERRDYAAPLWERRISTGGHRGHVATFMVGSVPTAALRRGAVPLAVWAASTAASTAMLAALEPDVIDVWSDMGYLSAFGGEGGVEASYWTFTSSLFPAVLAAYVVTQTSGWISDLHQGRVEMMRAATVSWARLVTGRLIAVVVASALITLVATVTLACVAGLVGSPLDATGVGRVVVTCLLFAAASGGLAAVVAATVPRAAAVTALALLVGTSYFLTYLVPLVGWPDWLNQLSLFWAFGFPYVEWPGPGRLLTLVTLAVGGTVVALVVANRSPSVP